jgi:hypothetical protein
MLLPRCQSFSSQAGRPFTVNSRIGRLLDVAILLSFPSATSQGRSGSTLSLMLIAARWLRWIVHILRSGSVESECGSGAYGNLTANPSDGYEYSFNGADAGVLAGPWPNIAPVRAQTTNSLFMPDALAASRLERDGQLFRTDLLHSLGSGPSIEGAVPSGLVPSLLDHPGLTSGLISGVAPRLEPYSGRN